MNNADGTASGDGTDVLRGIENLIGGAGADSLTGNEQANVLNGGAGADTLIGGAGNDTLAGDEGNDVLNGEEGDDLIFGGAGADTIDGGEGVDTLSYSGSDAAVTVSLASGSGSGGHANGDVLSKIENLIGGADADTLMGNEQANVLNGGGGADTLIGGAGNDTLIGGDGVDTASFINITSTTVSIVASLGTGTADGSATGDGTDVLRGIENLTGGAGADSLTGNEQANVLNGGAGADTLIGGAGNDTLIGGDGDDVLNLRTGNTSLNGDRAYGEAGDDTIIISQSQNNGNVILDGGEGVDTLQVWGTSGGSLNLLNILDLNAVNFEKLDVLADPGTANVLISSAGISKLVNNSGVDVLTLKLGVNDTYTIASESTIRVSVTQGPDGSSASRASFYNGTIESANLIAQVNFEYA